MKIPALITLIALALPQVVFVQDPPAPKPSGPIVELSLIVTDKDRKSVETIDKSEIQIIEDKVEQTLVSVERDDRPMSYGLVIDSSGSLRSLIGAALEAAKMIIINRRGSDEMFTERFVSSENIQILQDLTTDNNALLASLNRIRIEGGQSAIIDALYLGAEHLAKDNKTGESRRKAIVIITDGEDRKSNYGRDALLNLLRKNGIQVFVLGLVIQLDQESGFIRKSPRERAEKLLNSLAEESGGRVLYPRTGPDLIKAIEGLITELRRPQFRVTYQSSHPESKPSRKVDIKVTSPGGEKRRVVVYNVRPKDDQLKTKEQKSQ